MNRRIMFGALLVFSLVFLMAASCGSPTKTADGSGQSLSVKGFVQEVRAPSITELQFLSIKDDKGKLWEFNVDGDVGFTPSHLREHMVLGEQVTVYYKSVNGQMVAFKVTD